MEALDGSSEAWQAWREQIRRPDFDMPRVGYLEAIFNHYTR